MAAAALLVAATISISAGSTKIPLADVFNSLPVVGSGEVSAAHQKIISSLRLPRAVTAIAVGASLAVAGALLQASLTNPLASPEVTGVTAGSGFGAMIILLAVPDKVALVPMFALVFGLLASLITFSIAASSKRRSGITELILAGMAVGAIFAAATTLLMTAYADRVSTAIFFIAGHLGFDGWTVLKVAWPYLALGLVGAIFLIKPLNNLALGDEVAQSLGLRPARIRLAAAAIASLLAAASASLAGLLGFVGLIVPHLIRLAGGSSNNSYVIPVSAVAGAAVLLLADTIGRTVAAPMELPAGPFMVLLGVPFFLYLMRKAT